MTTALTAYTLATLQSDLQYLTGDTQGTRFSSAQLTDAINFAIKQLVTLKGYTYKEAALSATTGSTFPYGSYFTLNFFDYIKIKRVTITQGNNDYPLFETNMELEDVNFPDWRIQTGIPQRWALFDGINIVVFPLPSGSYPSWGLRVGYVQSPLLLATGSDTVDSRIPYTVQQYIKYGAAAWLLSLDQSDAQSLNTANLYRQTFDNLIGAA